FLHSSADFKTVTFITKSEDHEACSGNSCGLLATNTDNSIKTGLITIKSGLHLLVTGTMTVGNLVTLDGSFEMTFSENPFFLQVTATASVSLTGIGTIGSVAGALRIDGDGLALYASIAALGNFGDQIGLHFGG